MARRDRTKLKAPAAPGRLDSSTDRRIRLAAAAVILLGVGLRLFWLDSVPPSINQDEAVNAYDAWCLRETGQDHHGQRWPIFFRAFGDYHPGPPIYLQIPFQMIMGMNAWSARLPDALMGCVHIWLVFLLVRRFVGPEVGLLSALLLAISPWHVHISRLAFGLATSLALVTLGLLWICCAFDPPASRKRVWRFLQLLGAGLALGLALWTYHAMRVFVPLLLVAALALYAGRVRARLRRPPGWTGILLLACGFALGVAPFLWAWIHAPAQVWARALAMSPLQTSGGMLSTMGQMLHRYVAHFSPSYLFVSGDSSLVQSVPYYGQLNPYCALLLPLGLYRVIRNRRTDRFGLLVLCWILAGAAPAACVRLDTGTGHALRSAGSLPAYQILAALGLDMALAAARRYSRTAGRTAIAAAGAVMTACLAYFAYIFFVCYPPLAAPSFLAEWPPLLREVHARSAGFDAAVIPSKGHIGTLYLFVNGIEPKEYFAMPHYISERPPDDVVLRLGNIYFNAMYFAKSAATGLSPQSRVLLVTPPGKQPPRGTEVDRFRDASGKVFAVLWQVP